MQERRKIYSFVSAAVSTRDPSFVFSVTSTARSVGHCFCAGSGRDRRRRRTQGCSGSNACRSLRFGSGTVPVCFSKGVLLGIRMRIRVGIHASVTLPFSLREKHRRRFIDDERVSFVVSYAAHVETYHRICMARGAVAFAAWWCVARRTALYCHRCSSCGKRSEGSVVAQTRSSQRQRVGNSGRLS